VRLRTQIRIIFRIGIRELTIDIDVLGTKAADAHCRGSFACADTLLHTSLLTSSTRRRDEYNFSIVVSCLIPVLSKF